MLKKTDKKTIRTIDENKKRNIIISVCLILVITFLAFSPSVKNDFTNWDDNTYVTDNKIIKGFSWQNIKKIFTTYISNNYHPLTILSYSVEYQLFKLNPHIYHFTNLVFHLLNCILVFWLILILSNRILMAFIVALLFGIHPLHVESVAWISERKDVLYSFFFLGATISYLYYCRQVSKPTKINYYYLTLLLFVLSLLSKSMAVTLSVVLLLCDYILQRRFNKKILAEKIPFFCLSLIFSIVAILSQQALKSDSSGYTSTFSNNIMNASDGLAFYLAKLVIPFKLSAMYPHPEEIRGLIGFVSVFSPGVILALIVAIFFSYKRNKNIFFGGTFFLVTILPVIHLIPIGRAIPADRYTYIPSIGLFYIFTRGFLYLYQKRTKYSGIIRPFLVTALVGIIITFSFLTQNRCRIWLDSITLWSDVLRNYPLVHEAYNSRAIGYYSKGKYYEAVSDYTQAIKIEPDYAEAYYNRGVAYYNREKKVEGTSVPSYDKAIADFNQAIKIKPDYSDAYNNLGNVYFDHGNYDKAIFYFTKAINADPGFSDAYSNRGNAYRAKKEYDKAISDYTQAINIDPEYTKAYYNRGNVYGDKSEYDRAILEYTQAIRIAPDFTNAYYNRALAYLMSKRYEKSWEDVYRLRSLGAGINPKFLELLRKSSGREQ